MLKLTNGDRMMADAEGADIILLSFSKKEVVEGNIGDALDRLLQLSDSRELTEKFTNSISFMFEGWDIDNREIYEIPECVSFFRKLTVEWPFWFHFLEKECGSLLTLITLLCDVDKQFAVGGRVGAVIRDLNKVPVVMERLFAGMGQLHLYHNVSQQKNTELSEVVNNVIFKGIGL